MNNVNSTTGQHLKFFDFLETIKDHGPMKSADFVAIVLPFFQALAELHEKNKVAYLDSWEKLAIKEGKLTLEGMPREFKMAQEPLFVKPKNEGVFEVTSEILQDNNLDTNDVDHKNQSIDSTGESNKPHFSVGYKIWDLERGHYDPLTEIFALGQYLASLAFALDFRVEEDLELFVENRGRLYFLNKKLHPTLLNVIFEMTNLYREDRTANLEEVITKLKNYREYNPENYVDLTQTEGFRKQDLSRRGNWILSKLKNRLFDTSRRNKLLYFTDRKSFLNLTLSSVPLLLDYKNIREKDLIFWTEHISNKVIKKKKLVLNSYLDFGENRFLATTLNKIRLDANKSMNEFGFSQLRTVVAFIHWYNFKEDSNERITSPLLLLPTTVKKKKGVTDQYVLHFSESEAEVNPVLSHYLKELYDIQLPDFVDLNTTSIEELVETLKSQMTTAGDGISLEWRKTPRIQLIHSIARKSYTLRDKTLRRRSSGLNLRNFSYSYSREEFKPLGLQIFKERVKARNSTLEYIINEDLTPDVQHAVAEKSRTFYAADNDGEHNPTMWEIDTCNITLGNFNYRKMSLVQDYNEIIDVNIEDDIFEQLFSDKPKNVQQIEEQPLKLAENFPIIASDPTQTAAVQIARTGESYIIQGPPGTGKSQTITNLIADYIARDKKILFVCEKRAALDVVFHRLKNKKLDELCCLIHDSQTDKKAFIQNLKKTYESFLERPRNEEVIQGKRQKVIESLEAELSRILRFHKTMRGDHSSTSPIELFEVLQATQKHRKPIADLERIHLPSFDVWKKEREWVIEWVHKLQQNDMEGFVAAYPFAQIDEKFTNAPNPKALIHKHLESLTEGIDACSELFDELDAPNAHERNLAHWEDKVNMAVRIGPLLQLGYFEILEFGHSKSSEFNEYVKEIEALEAQLKEKEEGIKHWKNPYNSEDASTALMQWNKVNGSFLKFFNPSYYKLKKQVENDYAFSAHKVKPTVESVLEKLDAYHNHKKLVNSKKKDASQKYGFQSWEEESKWIQEMQVKPDLVLQEWLKNTNLDEIRLLHGFSEQFSSMLKSAKEIFGTREHMSLNDLDGLTAKANKALSTLSVFLPYIERIRKSESLFQNTLLSKKWSIEEFDYQISYKTIREIYAEHPEFSDMDEDALQASVSKVNGLLHQYYSLNVESIRSQIQEKFLEKIRISDSVAAQLTPEEKVLKKGYVSSRRILENEFGKSMRYKSIRDLASSDAQILMNAMKPVWLMSPLSVSDTMPIDSSLFDVVIYDEASQITVEEGVPSLFRTNQTIIVGDEMQMPPTNFFSTSMTIDEEEEENEMRVGISLDADSLLNQGTRKLRSVMLGWHYRSRHESLISFSNAAFYKRNLLTIPDARIQDSVDGLKPIASVEDTIPVAEILDRSISYCYLENAVYDKRKNKDEARYIARLVRELLYHENDLSIGVVAFSMDQQGEIEQALEVLASEDADFENRLEQEYQRVDDDQFNGLFVKNLENVQGDERDIIIMSVCYGSNAQGKMRMNFGPINRRGGEKRLNVIFSRAKKRMVVVTSIQPEEIKNDYNEGANYFKKFLKYAKNVSNGDFDSANSILESLHEVDELKEAGNEKMALSQLSKALKEKGYEVQRNIGQSHFKCDLAIKKSDQSNYALGILMDYQGHYNNENVLEQYCQKPQILRAFGWNVCRVLVKDWFEQPDRVLDKIEKAISEPYKEDFQIEDVYEELETSEEEHFSEPEEEVIVEEQENSENATSKDESSEFERYEFKEGASNKFWQIAVEGIHVKVQFGRIGNKPQERIKTFDSEEKALHEKEKMVQKKVDKGYQRV